MQLKAEEAAANQNAEAAARAWAKAWEAEAEEAAWLAPAAVEGNGTPRTHHEETHHDAT